MMFDAAHSDALLCAAELSREPDWLFTAIRVCRCTYANAPLATVAREHLARPHDVTRLELLARGVITKGDADAALDLIERYGDDGELRQHLVEQLRGHLTAMTSQ